MALIILLNDLINCNMLCYYNGDDSPTSSDIYLETYHLNAPIDIYKGVEHMKGVKAPNISMIKDEQELKDETDETVRKIWDNF